MILRTYSKDVAIPLPVTDFSSLLYIGISIKISLRWRKVIKGLSNGVEGMRVGDKRRLIIPPSLGYSEEGLKKENVPKNSWLVYEVEAVKVR
ncbi:hypothetical protein Bca101_031035 [Brassica carinata]